MRFPGYRIVKTAVAVFLTAFICQAIGWPPVFAVITAIVTLEPTVTDSIKKGIVRFPASAIGSFYAVVFIALFGNSALTYTLAAVLTILTCYRLKLHAGLLVATITAVAMIEVVQGNYWLSFFTRLGTTTIGLTVSTLVNMLIFPPSYRHTIEQNLQRIYHALGQTLQLIAKQADSTKTMMAIKREIEQTKQLIRYELEDTHFRTLFEKEGTAQTDLSDTLHQLELIHYHIHTISTVSIEKTGFSAEDQRLIQKSMLNMTQCMMSNSQFDLTVTADELKIMMRHFWKSKQGKESFEQSSLPNELILLYELTSLLALVNQYQANRDRFI